MHANGISRRLELWLSRPPGLIGGQRWVPLDLRLPSLESVFATDALNISRGGMYIGMS